MDTYRCLDVKWLWLVKAQIHIVARLSEVLDTHHDVLAADKEVAVEQERLRLVGQRSGIFENRETAEGGDHDGVRNVWR
jgi:hypothetical protein